MIELQMVHRMIRRGLVVAPPLLLVFLIFSGLDGALSAAIGLAMSLFNLYLSGRIIGGVAENKPGLLLPAAMLAFLLGLGVLTAIAFGLETIDVVTFKITGLVLIGSHLVLVLWEAAKAYPAKPVTTNGAAKARS